MAMLPQVALSKIIRLNIIYYQMHCFKILMKRF